MNIFRYLNYIKYISDIAKKNSSHYGYKAQMAKAAGCQRSYFSQVLAEKAELMPEHALGLCEFWQLSKTESEYFLNLVHHSRASTPNLKKYYLEKIKQMQIDQENLAKKFSESTILPDAKAAIYFSHWQNIAVLMSLTIPELQKPEKIAHRFEIPLATIMKTLEILKNLELAEQLQDGRWRTTNQTIHIQRESPYNTLNHLNWRRLAVDRSFASPLEGIHYTSVATLSRQDVILIKDLVMKLIEDTRKVIGPSTEEELYCLTCDWFKV